jgi:hypothetical protein
MAAKIIRVYSLKPKVARFNRVTKDSDPGYLLIKKSLPVQGNNIISGM